MISVIQNAIAFFLILFLGNQCREKGLLSKEMGRKLGKVVVYFTLPCAILSNVSQFELGKVFFLCISLSIVFQCISMLAGWLMSRKRSRTTQAAYVLNMGGFNLGNFAIPFATAFFHGPAIGYISMFDMGNAIMCLGMNKAIAMSISSGKNGFDWKASLKALFASVPFDTYLLLFVLSLFHVQIPEFILGITNRIGSANTFLSMFVVGILLDFKIQKKERKDVARVVAGRVLLSLVFSGLIWMLPVDHLIKVMLTIAVLSPSASITPIFSYEAGYKGDMPAVVSSITMVVSIILLSLMLMPMM